MGALLVLGLTAGSADAATQRYTFTFSSEASNATQGTVTGLLALDFAAPTIGTATGPARSIVITSNTTGFTTGLNMVPLPFVGLNTFTVTDGQITNFRFGSVNQQRFNRNSSVNLCLNSGAQFNIPGANFNCQANEVFYGSGLFREGVYNGAGAAAVTFMPAIVPVPLPALLLATGLGALSLLRRRRRMA